VKVVIDTNILLTCVSTRSKTNWIFRALLAKRYVLCVTTEILLEYAEVIEREMGFNTAEAVLDTILNSPNLELVTLYYNWDFIKNDPDDNKFVDCAIACDAAYLITHDKHFKVLEDIDFPKEILVVSAKEFGEILDVEQS